jgi:hypothetical protein
MSSFLPLGDSFDSLASKTVPNDIFDPLMLLFIGYSIESSYQSNDQAIIYHMMLIVITVHSLGCYSHSFFFLVL